MSRAAVIYKAKDELRIMSTKGLQTYIAFLNQKAEFLRGPARKSVEKRAAVAEKLLALSVYQPTDHD
jgi:hypothetical protein